MPPALRPPSEPNPWRVVGMAMSIPMMLLAGALVGAGLGWLIRRWTGWGSWVDVVAVALGLTAGVREALNAFRRMK